MGKMREDLCDSQPLAQDNTWNYLRYKKLGIVCPACMCIMLIMFDKTYEKEWWGHDISFYMLSHKINPLDAYINLQGNQQTERLNSTFINFLETTV